MYEVEVTWEELVEEFQKIPGGNALGGGGT